MLSTAASRSLVAALEKASIKRVMLAQQRQKNLVLRSDRFYHHSTTGAAAASSSVCLDTTRRRGEEENNNFGPSSVYQRAMPRYIAPSGGLAILVPTIRSFSSTTEAQHKATVRQRVMDRASQVRDRASQRASAVRDRARTQYEDFREHPRESMREGAKSFSGMLRKYGPVFVGTYASVYLTTLGSLFAIVQSGLLDPAYLFNLLGHVDAGETKNTVDLVVEWMKNHSFTEPYAPFMERNPYLANLAVAWIAVKFTEPVRAGVSLAITPRVSRALGYTTKTDEHLDDDEEEAAPNGATSTAAEPNVTESKETTAEKKA